MATSGPEKIVRGSLLVRMVNGPKGPPEGEKLRLMNGVGSEKVRWWWFWR